MDTMVLPWVLSGASIAFLIGCAEYNRRTGYKRVRATESPLEEALIWIAEARSSVSVAAPEPVRLRSKLGDIVAADASTQQLIRLYTAVREAETPLSVPADMTGEYALSHK
jgi:hypothetical protein